MRAIQKLVFIGWLSCSTCISYAQQADRKYVLTFKSEKSSYLLSPYAWELWTSMNFTLAITSDINGEKVGKKNKVIFDKACTNDTNYSLEAIRTDGEWGNWYEKGEFNWKSSVSGVFNNPDLLTADISYAAINMKPGKYRVRWRYDPLSRNIPYSDSELIYSNWVNIDILPASMYTKRELSNYKVALKMLKHTYKQYDGSYWASKREFIYRRGIVDLNFVVTVTNLGKDSVDFGPKLWYNYKNSCEEEDYYMEATDMKGKLVDIDGNSAFSFGSPPPGCRRNANKITDTISTDIYHINPGKYRVRWVYDPANKDPYRGRQKPAGYEPEKITIKPVYSNWETIEVVR